MNPAETRRADRGRTGRRRVAVVAAAALVAAVDLGAKTWAEAGLPPAGVEAGPVDLKLAYNAGVAFSLGADAPAALVIAVTAAIIAAVAVIAWRLARDGGPGQLAAVSLVLGGAVANLVDRAADGVVTDYLHTGWWPTFNLADVAIVTGALLLALTSWLAERADRRDRPPDAAPPAAEGATVIVPGGGCEEPRAVEPGRDPGGRAGKHA